MRLLRDFVTEADSVILVFVFVRVQRVHMKYKKLQTKSAVCRCSMLSCVFRRPSTADDMKSTQSDVGFTRRTHRRPHADYEAHPVTTGNSRRTMTGPEMTYSRRLTAEGQLTDDDHSLAEDDPDTCVITTRSRDVSRCDSMSPMRGDDDVRAAIADGLRGCSRSQSVASAVEVGHRLLPPPPPPPLVLLAPSPLPRCYLASIDRVV